MYELTKEWYAVAEAADQEEMEGALAQLGGKIPDPHERIESTLKAIRNAEGQADMAKTEASNLSARAKMFSEEGKRLRRFLVDLMEVNELKKHKGVMGTVSHVPGKPRVEVTDESVVPDDFVDIEIVRKVRKKDVADFIKKTGEIPNGIDWVHGEDSVTIRFGG